MKVVAVVPAYLPDSRVGAWIATHNNLRALVDRGHDVHVYTIFGHDRRREVDGVKVEGLGPGLHPRILDADVCVSHLGDRMSAAAENCRLASVPHVVMVHGGVEHGEPDANLVVFNSQSNQACASWVTDSIVCHPKTVIEDHVSPRGLRNTLVNMSAAKGAWTFRQVAAQMPHHKFLGVRGGYGAQVVATEQNVTTWDTVLDMREVWAQTRILLMPSVRETWGMVGVEAMCSGIPVIAHPTPGLVESLGDAGIFVDRNDIYGWRKKIYELGDPETYQLWSKRSFERAEELAAEDGPGRFADEIELRFG